jgi:anti-anti-sigma factor
MIDHFLAGDEGRTAVVNINGYVDSTTAHLLKERLVLLAPEAKRFILDFSNVNYVSSAGWGVILGRIKETREKQGDIVFVNMVKEVYSIYELLELNRVIKYFPTLDAAAQHYGEKITAAKQAKPVEPVAPQKPREISRKMTLEEAVRAVVSRNPLLNSGQLKTIIQGPPYSIAGLNRLKMYFTLRRMGFGSKEKRLYFAWQSEKRAKRK